MIELFPFRYFDRGRGRWVRANYKLSRANLEARTDRWEITGEAEIRDGPEPGGHGVLAQAPPKG